MKLTTSHYRKPFVAAAALLFAGLPIAQAIDVAGTLLIDLEANDYVNGSGIWAQSYANRTAGTGIVGNFNADQNPTKQTIAGATAILFDGGDRFVGPQSTFALDPIDGSGADRSIEVWAWQSTIRAEESMVSWSSRTPGANGTNMSFNYGNDTRWGAVGHWGGADMGWDPAMDNNPTPTTNYPTLGEWHLLTYVYSGATGITTVYKDGAVANTENSNSVNGGPLNTKTGFSINIGAQRQDAGALNGELNFTGALSKVRIHSGALSGTQVLNNYNAEQSIYRSASNLDPAPLTRAPILRWDLNNAAGAIDVQAETRDFVAGASAFIRGAGATFTGSGVDLPGGASGTQGYIDLPNNIISGKDNLSIEFWVTPQSTNSWSRMMDFGANSAGEVTGPGGAFNGDQSHYIMLTNNVGMDQQHRLERHVPGGNTFRVPEIVPSVYNTQIHVVVTYDSAAQEWKYFRDGILQVTISDTAGPRTINDVNTWLGRSNFAADGNFDGIYNEVRIYNYTLSTNQVLGNFNAGPDAVNTTGSALAWTPTAGGTFNFNNASGQNNWGTGAGGTFPNATDATGSLVVDLTGNQTVQLNTNVTIGQLAIGDSDSTDGGNTVTIAAGTGGRLTFSVSSGSAALSSSSNSAGDTISAPITLNSPLEVTAFSTSNPLTIVGTIGGASALTTSGPGTVILTGTNNYTGTTTAQSGVLQIGNGGTTGSLPASDLLVSGRVNFNRSDAITIPNNINIRNTGTVSLIGAGNATFSGTITGNGRLVHDGSGVLDISGNDNHTGITQVNSGTLTVSGIVNGTGAFLDDSIVNLGGSGKTTVGGYLSVGITDGGVLNVQDNATLAVAGDFNVGDIGFGFSTANITGGTTTAGALYVGKNIGADGAIIQTGGTFGRPGAGGADWRIGGGGDGQSTTYGSYTLLGGTFNSSGGNMQIGAGGYGLMEVSGGTAVLGNFAVVGRFSTGVGVLNITGGTVEQNNAGALLIIGEQGRGQLALSGDNSSLISRGGIFVGGTNGPAPQGTGVLNLNGGTLTTPFIRGGNIDGNSLVNLDGTKIVASRNEPNFLEGLDSVVVQSGGAIFDTNGSVVTVLQDLLAPIGGGILSIDLQDGGSGYVSAPIVEVLGDGTGATAVAKVTNGVVTGITVTSPGSGYVQAPTIAITGGGGSGLAVDAIMVGDPSTSGGLTKVGAGTLTLAGNNSYGGATKVNEGTLQVDGSISGSGVTVAAGAALSGSGTISAPVTINGTLAPGSNFPGTLSFDSSEVKLGAAATSVFELQDTFVFDRLSGTGKLTLDGTFVVTLVNGFSPQNGDSFDLFDFNTVDATGFNVVQDLQLPVLDAGLFWNTSDFVQNGVLVVVPEPSALVALASGATLLIGLRRRRRA